MNEPATARHRLLCDLPLCDLPLCDLPLCEPARVVSLHAPVHAPEWADWLAQLGFLPGERVSVMARARPGGDPLVVRIGDSTFALRRAEAACILVAPIAGALLERAAP